MSYLISYIHRPLRRDDISYYNTVTKERPADWLISILKICENEAYVAMIFAIEITDEEYDKLRSVL